MNNLTEIEEAGITAVSNETSSDNKENNPCNWAELGKHFEDFNGEITNRWINEGFTAEQAKEWLITKNFNSFRQYVRYSGAVAYWLQNIIQIQHNDLTIYSEE